MLVRETVKSFLRFRGHAAAAPSAVAVRNAPLKFCTCPMETPPAWAVFSSAYPIPPSVAFTWRTSVSPPCASIPPCHTGDELVPTCERKAGLVLERKSVRSEEHTSELQSPDHLVCRLLLEKKKRTARITRHALPRRHNSCD